MTNLFRILTGIIMMMYFSLGATAQISGTSDPFTFDTRSTAVAVPLSGIAMGVAVLLIIGFIAWRHVFSRKKAGV